MKTSNKILLTIFISVLLIITLIHVALNQRYKNGQFTVTDLGSGQAKDSIVLKAVKYVRLTGLENVVIIPSDNYTMEVSKQMPSSFKHYVSGDTLVVTGGQSGPAGPGENDYAELNEEVRIYLPKVDLITAQHAGILLAGATDSAYTGSTTIQLDQSRLSFKNYRRGDESSRYYGDVSIIARVRSEVELAATNIYFNSLAVQLEKSNFKEQLGGDIKKFSILADDASTVQVGGSNLKKLAAVTKE